MNKQISDTIQLLRFPMICGIVFIHTINQKDNVGLPLSFYDYLYNFISKGICSICVPLFFCISGYLFFSKDEWNTSIYLSKLRKRFFSLFIPYLLWTVIGISIFALFQSLLPSLISGSHQAISEWKWPQFIINGLWRYEDEGSPFVGQFWFIRDLLLIVILSPFIYLYVKTFKLWGIIILGGVYYFQICRYFVPGSIGIFFFCWGAYYSIHHINFLKSNFLYSISWLCLPLFLIDACTKTFCINEWIHSAGIVLGIPFLIHMVDISIRKYKWKIPEFLTASAFFIYASHEPYFTQVQKVLYKNIPIYENSIAAEIELTIMYFIVTILYILFLLLVYYILTRTCPLMVSFLCGGRDIKIKKAKS